MSSITDSHMHATLSAFVLKHPYVQKGPISSIDEGTFTTIKRMRTLMPIEGAPQYANATTIELRGQWHYPVMMMNDCMPIDPDPPTILLRDRSDGVVVRFRPKTIADVERVLEKEVFDVENYQKRMETKRLHEAELIEARRVKEAREIANRQATEEAARIEEALLAQKRAELDAKLKLAIESAVSDCDDQIKSIAMQLSNKLNISSYELQHNTPPVSLFNAFDGGRPYAVQSVSKEIERRVYLALMNELNVGLNV